MIFDNKINLLIINLYKKIDIYSKNKKKRNHMDMERENIKLITIKEEKNIEPKINHLKLLKLNYYNNVAKELEKINIIGDPKIAFINRTIKNLLICKYLENTKNFDLVNSLKIVINVINNSKHRTTKNIPKDKFYSNDEELFKIVKFNTINSFKNYKSELIELKENDNIVIFNNFDKIYRKKDKLYILEKSKIKKKNCLFDICGTIINRINLFNTGKNYSSGVFLFSKRMLCFIRAEFFNVFQCLIKSIRFFDIFNRMA